MATKDTGGQKRTTKHDETEDIESTVDESAVADEVQERHDKLTDDVDSLLDEIDGVLEENAEEFVRAYVQKGGE